MDMTMATPKKTVGQSLVKPSDFPSDTAQTASSIPEKISTIQDTGHHPSWPSCRDPGTAPSSGGPFAVRLHEDSTNPARPTIRWTL